MFGKFIVENIWSDGFSERYAIVTYTEKQIKLGVYFLINNDDVSVGDVLTGELIINCAKICAPVELTNNIEMVTHFKTTHDTNVTAKASIISVDEKESMIRCCINDDFNDITVEMLNDFSFNKYSLGDIIYIKGLLDLKLSE